MIVIGLGTGRSGTASLTKLLNSQRDALCFHEMNPTSSRFFGAPRPVLNTIDEFQAIIDGGDPSMLTLDFSREVAVRAYEDLRKMKRVQLIGDIAFYYLSYVELIAAHTQSVRFVCLRRTKAKTVKSWLRQASIKRWPSKILADRLASLITREPYYTTRNFWVEHDGSKWLKDPVWDKCFPKFEARTVEDAVSQYWDYYYAEAERLASRLPSTFMIVDTEQLNTNEAQSAVLSHCGVEPSQHVHVDAHIHKSPE